MDTGKKQMRLMTSCTKVVFFKVSSLRSRHSTHLSNTCIQTRSSTASDRSPNKIQTWTFFNWKEIKLLSKHDETLFSRKRSLKWKNIFAADLTIYQIANYPNLRIAIKFPSSVFSTTKSQT